MIAPTDIIPFVIRLFPAECRPFVWLTGGAVRDSLLNQPARDIDLAAALSPERLASLGFRPVAGKTTPFAWIRHDSTLGMIEVTPLENSGQLDADLSRRDFTINAMAISLAGELIDPLQGASDLPERTLRVCSPLSFHNDPLRIFRGFRLTAEGWQLAPETGELIRIEDWDDRLAVIPVERFARELLKAASAPFPGRFFQQMLTYAVGGGWLPELFRMPQIPAGPPEHHPEGDLFTHSLQVLERTARVTDSPLARFCAFFHDLGKITTDPRSYPRHHGHEEAGFRSAPRFARRLALPAAYGMALAWISRLHGNFNRLDRLRDSTALTLAGQALRTGIADLLPLVAMADKPGGEFSEKWDELIRVAAMTAAELEVAPERLALIAAEQRRDFLLQKRVELLRSRARQQEG